MTENFILIEGAKQNNLKGFTLRIPLNKLTVITGVSGSGKSSLAFDTIYSEGQRRYVETFSPYTRQFLARMDKPKADRIEGIPPAIAIDQTNPVRTSRSTVGTMTELNDHIKLLFARAAQLFCSACGKPVRRDSPDSIYEELESIGEIWRKIKNSAHREVFKILITFPIHFPEGFTQKEVEELLALQGYRKIHRKEGNTLEVIQDRTRLSKNTRGRIVEGLEAALKYGRGYVNVYPLDDQGRPADPLPFSTHLHCALCNIHYQDPVPNLFSFNSPIGACETCRGFGRIIGIDYDLVVPDDTKTLKEGAVKPWQTNSYRECQQDLLLFTRKRGIPSDVPWRVLTDNQRHWILEGEGRWEDGKWYGVKRFFKWLETKSYRMHIRVLLSKYRAYKICPACAGARLKPQSLLWRIDQYNVHELMLLPIESLNEFFVKLELPKPLDEATQLLLREVHSRLGYLVDVGLGYLTLDRQSRTLSGGEVQRINLTTALGTSLVNTLFVLDEPSIGLHSRDIRRLINVLHRLRDAGNTLIVVEHDPDVIRAADVTIDMGPGAGERGGEVVFFGNPQDLLHSEKSLTAQYLSGKKTVSIEKRRIGSTNEKNGIERSQPVVSPGSFRNKFLKIIGAREHNLKNIDVYIPLQHIVCITGVSGSGKSTLVQDILYNSLCKRMHKPVETPGLHRILLGYEQVDDVVLVDQSPIGKTTRSNPASYVGAFDSIRKLFSKEPLSLERKYTPGTFSFNSGKGRCPTCGGNGFERIEMQFLSDVYIRCPDCDGRRYRQDVLDVKVLPFSRRGYADGNTYNQISNSEGGRAKSIADILEMTVNEAHKFFFHVPEVLCTLEPLQAVGLDYMTLGQPVPTLSGGEAQRLKLAGHLARRRKPSEHTLFLFDEPTTGLHFDDIAKLLQTFQRLIFEGHSIVVIEHNLDVIAAADWIIDLGPEGGNEGGEIICEGTPGEVAKYHQSHTGRALLQRTKNIDNNKIYKDDSPRKPLPIIKRSSSKMEIIERSVAEKNRQYVPPLDHSIIIRHAREHNLKGIDVRIPRDMFTVITGVSGSGKSTVAFDILFSEGQRRYLESLNAYARQFVRPATRPDVDGVFGIPPTVAIEQRTSIGGKKSTVATMTEIYHFLRLLFTKLGTQYCPECEIPITSQTSEAILAKILQEFRGKQAYLFAPLITARKGYYTELSKWAAGKGFSHLRVDGDMIPTHHWPRLDRFKEHNIELPIDKLYITSNASHRLKRGIDHALEIGKGHVLITAGHGENEKKGPATIFSTIRACPRCGRSFGEPDPRSFSFNSKHGWCPSCYGTGLTLSSNDRRRMSEEPFLEEQFDETNSVCVDCNGKRLRPEALSVKLWDKNIAGFTALSVEAAEEFFRTLKLKGVEATIARDVISELSSRLNFLKRVGLPYLSLDRTAPTLSGGEAQRIRLASQLGSNLRGVCYILDEPTIGLHARDNFLLLHTLEQLKSRGNTIVVVEHDEATIRRAEHIVDLGPGGGPAGGLLVVEGSIDDIVNNRKSVTGKFLREPLRHPLLLHHRKGEKAGESEKDNLEIVDAHMHNLKNLYVKIPLGQLVCITGVSGSGKSTLAREVMYDNLRRLVGKTRGRSLNGRDTFTGKNAAIGRDTVAGTGTLVGTGTLAGTGTLVGTGTLLRGCREIKGQEVIGRVLEVDQTPIGKTPRSCPATYVGFWDQIRQLFSHIPEARMRGFSPSRFSFNVSGGRCEVCAGQGVKKIKMSFLPDVSVLCESCEGKRYTPETLAVQFKDKSIADVLAMSVDEASDFFKFHPQIHHALHLLQEVGLGYLSLGQQSPTLSGGEAQRIKLVTELAKTRPAPKGHTPEKEWEPVFQRIHSLYVLDEPTIGLHMADVEKLIRVLHRLVDAGNTVVIIEHNLDVIAEADWIIDLGPEGGERGGYIVAEGAPESIARIREGSYTARFLSKFLKTRRFSRIKK